MLSELFFVYLGIYCCFFVIGISALCLLQKFIRIADSIFTATAAIFALIATETFYKIFF